MVACIEMIAACDESVVGAGQSAELSSVFTAAAWV
jgi:hypothetical protein